jgi:senataxin
VKNAKNKIESKSLELEKQISKLDQEIANLRASGRKGDLTKAENEMQKLVKELQRVGSNTKPIDVNKGRLRMDLMLKSDIVLSTLNSCHQSSIEQLYRTYASNTFNCVIVDEASQCSEPELLMPLVYKMTKMILIGDPMQLSATVISKKANSLKFGRSLFERFYKYFNDYSGEQKSPILMLNLQYRMHPQICEFPSLQFYSGKLLSSDKVIQNRNFQIKPYVVFDVTDTKESRKDPRNKFNELEADFVTKLVTIIDNIVQSNQSIGIITPYNGQKKHISEKIKGLNLKMSVEVNTVDGFQGQERDVIVLSCVRAFDEGNGNNVGFLKSVQRMNVALTRAKYSLILCISGRSLESDHNWKCLIENAMKRANCRYKVPSTIANEKIIKMIENTNYSK